MLKKILFSTMLFVFTCSIASIAQQRDAQRMDPEAMTKRRVEMLQKELSLNPEQTKKVQELYQSAYANRQNTAADRQQRNAENREEMMKKMQEEQNKTNESIKKILNADQLVKFEKLLKEQAERRSNPRGNRSVGGNGR